MAVLLCSHPGPSLAYDLLWEETPQPQSKDALPIGASVPGVGVRPGTDQ